jgi:uncharacterized membrane protein YccC
VLTLLVSAYFDLPAVPAAVSAVIIGMAPDRPAMVHKGWQRALGAVVGGGYAFVGLLILARLPYLGLLLTFVFVGMFLAAYFTKASQAYSYVALQMGMVVPMVLIGQQDELGHPWPAVQRFVGVWTGLSISLAVHWVWTTVQRRLAG